MSPLPGMRYRRVRSSFKIAYVKAAARDIKAYLKGINSNVLVGYSATDGDSAFRNSMAHYMTCGTDINLVDLYGK